MKTAKLTDLSWMSDKAIHECIKKELHDARIEVLNTKPTNINLSANDSTEESAYIEYIKQEMNIGTILGKWRIWDWKLFRIERSWLAITEEDQWFSDKLAKKLNKKMKNTLRIDGTQNGCDTYGDIIDEYHIDTFEALQIFSLAASWALNGKY